MIVAYTEKYYWYISDDEMNNDFTSDVVTIIDGKLVWLI